MIEQAIFTAIPVGRLPDGRLRITVFVTPKLAVSAPPVPGDTLELAAFEAFANWPRTLADARFAFEVDGIGVVEGTPLDDPVTPSADLWEALFGATSVGDAGFQHFERAVVQSYPVEEVLRTVTELYRTVAVQSGTTFPPITSGPLADFLSDVGIAFDPHRSDWAHSRRERKALVARWRDESEPFRPPGVTKGRFLDIDTVDPAERRGVALAAASAFYDRSDDPLDPATATAPAPTPVPPEFHTFIARCADHPELLRHLGLAVDLCIPDDPGIHEHARIRLLDGLNQDPLERLLAPQGARPFTLAHRTERFWAPAPAREEPDIRDGSLVVDDDERFLVDQADPDGAALKVASLATNLSRTAHEIERSAAANGGAPSMTDDASSLPALRSTGLIIARRNRAESIVRAFDTTAGHEDDRRNDRAAMLGAVEVTRGWRIDVQDRDSGTGTWFSLHRRRGTYELLSPGAASAPLPLPEQPAPDEGYLKAATTSSTRPDVAADQYLHETLAGWDGWSLAVKRPGKVVDETGAVDPTVDPAAVDPASGEVAGPGDGPGVAATGFPLAARFAVEPGSLPRLRFGRSYRIRVRAVDLSGESIPGEQLDPDHERDLDAPYQRWEPVPSPAVIPLTEYTEGESLMRLVIRSTLGVPVGDYVRLDRVSSLPGHAASGDLGIVYREQNERNLAAPLGSVQLAETHGVLDAAFAGDPVAVAQQFDVAAREAGSYLTLPGGRVVSGRPVPTTLDGEKDQRLEQGEYVVHPNRALSLPYLPDPIARGVSFTTLPGDGAPGTATRLIRWPGEADTWFDRRPILVRVVEGVGAPAFDQAERTLTVPLPKATLTTVRLSSFLDDDDVELMRIRDLMRAAPTPPSAADLARIRQGLHWMITPFAELTLVHAVEKPLEPPSIVLDPRRLRVAGATYSFLPGTVRNHAASTGRIDLDATWNDPIDDVLSPRWRNEPKGAHVADFPVQQNEPAAIMWEEQHPPAGPIGPRHEVRHEFGDTRHRYVTYTPTATTRFREYFPPQITDVPELVTSVGERIVVDVPSSARPLPPDVRYTVPTWSWEETAVAVDGSPLAVRRVRTGGGLRVYLGRPWWSSGPDEQLGVVLPMQPWITWPFDLVRGVVGTLEAQAAAESWARRTLDASGLRASGEGPLATQLAEQVASAVSAFRAAPVTRAGREEDAASGVVRLTPTHRFGGVGVPPVGGGVVAGFRVGSDGGRLTVTPGEAVDGFGRPIVPPRVRARNTTERFLLRADEEIVASRRLDPAISTLIESAVTSKLIADHLWLFRTTGPEGRRFCSVWGADPVFAGEPLPAGPFTHQFPLRTSVGTGVTLAEVPDEATVVGHTPEFDEERGLWYCDIQVDAGDAYTPFIQLALARYQSHSVRGQEISKIVKADWAQLLPRREATFIVAPTAAAAAVTLSGTVGIPEHARALPDLASKVNASRRVEAWVERKPAGAGSDLDWERAGDPVALDVRLGLAALRNSRYADVEWAGAVALPDRQPGDRVRVRIAEYEIHVTDPDPGGGWVVHVLRPRDRRLVYADEVEVPEV